MKTYNIQYILITKEMKNTKIWGKHDDGLLFLIENTKTFTQKFQNENIEIWKLNPNN